ncbi:MAG: helix-turn-helix domain-containing protein [Candidatus Promineifilaceae bacterium]
MEQSYATDVTLDNVLRLVLPLSTEVVGGEAVGRQVSWTSVLTEFSKLQDQVRAGDIVILPDGLQAQVDDKTLAEGLEVLANNSAAALLVFKPVSTNVIQAAARYDLPILVVSGDVSLRDALQDISGLLVDRQKQISERGMQLYRRLTEISREGQGLTAMTEIMSKLTGKIVSVQDKRLEFKALTIPHDSDVDEMELRAVLGRPETLPKALRDRKAAANMRQSQWQQLLPMGETQMARLLSPIISGDRARGFVSVVGRPDELDLLDALTAEQGAAACALEMAKVKAISETRKTLRGNFLEGLLAGKLTEPEIQRLAGRLGHDTNRLHAIMTFTWDGENNPSLRRLETPISWLLSGNDWPALTHTFADDYLCVFLALHELDEEMSSAVELAHRVQELLRSEFPEVRLLCGLSGPASTLAEWPVVHQQAVLAMQLAQRLHMNTVSKFDSLGINELLSQLEQSPALQRFCDLIIGPLVQYDREHRSSHVATIRAYFDHHGNVSQTADALFIHRNTLLYRLERIQEMTGQNLDQADARLALQLALKLWVLRPGVDSDDIAWSDA